MHESGRTGILSGTTDDIARLARCSTADLTQALSELQRTKAADVTFRNNNVTVINRLMKREAKVRQDTALRVKKHRSNGKCNEDETGEKLEVRSKKLESNNVKVKERTKPAPDFPVGNQFRQPVIPTLAQVKEAFYKQGGNQDMALKFFSKHDATGWFLNGSPIVNWSALVGTFISNYSSKESNQGAQAHNPNRRKKPSEYT